MATDTLFAHIERAQGPIPWGRVLDAGTGAHSLKWLASLETVSWTAVTADPRRASRLAEELGGRMRPGDGIVCGDWSDPALLHGELFDVVLADYLIGAVEAFTPYFQDLLPERLRRHLRPQPSSRLYVVGLESYPEETGSRAGEIVRAIARLRDACILLAGHRCHREFPLQWTIRRLERAGFEIVDAAAFPIVYGRTFVGEQLDICRRKLRWIEDRRLAAALERRIEDLREEALEFCARHGGLRFGEDYVVSARPAGPA